ncbi:DUF5591 domain-containing protein [Candidatus Micrarchaeota archaeon]|nr:DUF5591 domain-containing protein [Candidatus Micrarchaeota archaeon]
MENEIQLTVQPELAPTRELHTVIAPGKCSWGECTYCGWGRVESKVDVERMKAAVLALNLNGVRRLKVFTSGSFLDDAQYPPEFRNWFADYVFKKKNLPEFVLESRPEYLTKEALAPFPPERTLIAIGLESSDDEVLARIQKGFTFETYKRAAQLCRSLGYRMRTFLMVNAPGQTQEVLGKSVEDVLPLSDEIVLINTYPHSNTPLARDWLEGNWQPMNKKEFWQAVAKWKDAPGVECDDSNFAFVPKFPAEVRAEVKEKLLTGAKPDNLENNYYRVWQDYFCRFYEPPAGKDICLLLPCSYRKPYERSETHKKIYGALYGLPASRRVHRVVVSNPGVIPIEYSDGWPFHAYDWPEQEETPELMQMYVEVTKKRVNQYALAHKGEYKRFFAYFKHTETWEAVRQAFEELGVPITNLLDDQTWEKVKGLPNAVTQPQALEALKKGLAEII